MRDERLVDLADRYAWTMVEEPYIWGGDDFTGRDCSGFVVAVLQGVGRFPHGADAGANALMKRYPVTTNPKRGCLVLFGMDGTAGHIGWVTEVLGPDVFILEAGGGGSKTLTVADAAKQNAFNRLRKIHGPGCRPDVMCYVDPFEV